MKTIFLLLSLLFMTEAYCQQNTYQGVTAVSADGITFEVKLSKYSFFLRNAANTRSQRNVWRYKDGRELETEDEYAVVDADVSPGSQNRAIREAFGDTVISSLRSYNYSPMTIFYVIGPDGDTLEVSFIMDAVPELVSLAPKVFAALERNLKKYVKWEVNAYGRQLEFFHVQSFVKFDKVPLDSELHKIKPDVSLNTGSDLDIAE